ncbi:MFS transporter [Streptomyces sp. E5N91]|uniref:MFS transporter n=1 Tax=Streptomyces sp. E5N91 TaxID=1851996 RepID=UPI000EF58509|nr:MFS transporter [Streptomyces sp. E5N91]
MTGAVEAGQKVPLRRNRDFWFLWTGVGVATWGNAVTSAAYPLLLIWNGGSASAAGLVGFAGLLPVLLVQLPAGVFVDRWDRRRTMVVCNAVCAVSLASVGVALLFGRLWLPHLMIVAFAEGSAFVFYRLSERAAVVNVVHPDQLPTAMAQNQARGRAAGLAGQPTGSSLFVLARWAPFLFTAVLHLVALVNLLFIKSRFQSDRAPRRRRLRTEVAEGIGWMFRQEFLRTAILLVSVTNVLFQALRLAIVVIINEHGGSPAFMGVIGVLSGVGGISGAMLGPLMVRRFHPGAVITGVFAVWTCAMPLVAMTSQPVFLGALMSVMLFAGALINVIAGVYQVQVTPDELQGRVGSVASLISSGANSMGPLLAGLLLASVGGSRTVLCLSVVMAAVTVTALLSRPIRAARLKTPDASAP